MSTESVLEKNETRELTTLENFDSSKVYDEEFYDKFIENFQQTRKKKICYRVLKRIFDFIVSLVALIVFIPLFLIISIALKCDSKGPVIFKQKRMGKNGKPFNFYKFRSMRIDAPHDCATSVLKDPGRYYTKVGKFLRKTSLDELPQLWCVLFGKMSIIGYRPLVLTEEKCNDMRNKLGVFKALPGISGYAQVMGRDDVYYKNKALLDAEYVKKASLWMDIKIFFKTIWIVVKKEGNDAGKE